MGTVHAHREARRVLPSSRSSAQVFLIPSHPTKVEIPALANDRTDDRIERRLKFEELQEPLIIAEVVILLAERVDQY